MPETTLGFIAILEGGASVLKREGQKSERDRK